MFALVYLILVIVTVWCKTLEQVIEIQDSVNVFIIQTKIISS